MTPTRRPGLRHNAALIARREYLDRVPTRSFLVATAIMAAIAIGLALAPIGMRYLDRGSTVTIGISAQDPALATSSIAILDGLLNHVPPDADPATWAKPYRFDVVASQSDGIAALGRGALRGLLIVDRLPSGDLAFTFRTPDSASSPLSQLVQFAAFGVAILDRGTTFTPPTVQVISTSAATDGGRPIDAEETANRSIVATVLIVLIFVTLTIYGMWVATSVAAEKSTRVMELLVNAASPRQLLVGKVIGVGGAGLTQYIAILIPAGALIIFQEPIATFLIGPGPAGGEPPLVGLTLPILLAFGVFFILGFVLYALLYAAAGSLVNRQEDVQQLALPLSLISMASYFAAVVGLGSIGSTMVRVLSFVPFSSPFVMLARLMLGRVEPLELVASITILILSSVVVLWLAARIYATGVLLYGQRPGILGFIRAARRAGG